MLSSRIQVAFVILVLARFEILDQCVFFSFLYLMQMQTMFDSCLLRKREDKVTAAMVRLQLEESHRLYFMETRL